MAMIRDIGQVTGSNELADRLLARFVREIESVESLVRSSDFRVRVVCLEWIEPLFACGHWIPELVEIAGGRECLGRGGEPSREISWNDLAGSAAELRIIAPCGRDLRRAVSESSRLEASPRWPQVATMVQRRIFCCDGSAYFSRPGPRLIETLDILAELIDPDRFPGRAPPGSFQQIL
jgi:iron complex transport system substrate-binding protein